VFENQRSGGRYAPAPLSHALPQKKRQRAANNLHLRQHQPNLPRRPFRRPPLIPKQTRRSDINDQNGDKDVKSGGLNFLGLKLPELPELPKLSLPFFGGDDDEDKENAAKRKNDQNKENIRHVDGMRVKSEAIPVSLGRRPPKDALEHNVRIS
jgi:hypothetical protein